MNRDDWPDELPAPPLAASPMDLLRTAATTAEPPDEPPKAPPLAESPGGRPTPAVVPGGPGGGDARTGAGPRGTAGVDQPNRSGVLGAIFSAMGQAATEPPPLAVAAEPPPTPETHPPARDNAPDARTAEVTAIRHWNALTPVCGRCWSRWYTETELAGGGAVLSCFCCREPVDGSDQSAAWAERQADKIAEREAEDSQVGAIEPGDEDADSGSRVSGKPKTPRKTTGK